MPTAERETNGQGDVQSGLHVLAAGLPATDGGEFIASHVLAERLETLSARAEVVLVDAPPLLTGSDAMALSASVHALVVVLRFDHVRRPVLSEVRRTLERCPAEKLGFIVTGTDAEGAYDYGARRDRRYERLLEKSLPGGRRR